MNIFLIIKVSCTCNWVALNKPTFLLPIEVFKFIVPLFPVINKITKYSKENNALSLSRREATK